MASAVAQDNAHELPYWNNVHGTTSANWPVARFFLHQRGHQLGLTAFPQRALHPKQLNTCLHQCTASVVAARMLHAVGFLVQMHQEYLKQEIHDLKSPKGLSLAALLNVREIYILIYRNSTFANGFLESRLARLISGRRGDIVNSFG